MAPAPGDIAGLIPDYEVGDLIAQGGMGAIYRGVQSKLDRPVAIKVLPKQHGADLDYAARFEQEAKAMARLSHNNIVGVYDYGETTDGTLLYFIMELVEGSDLFGRLHKGPIGSDEAISILEQICDALRYAHENGIIHRDIKPANILLDAEGNVKMADFGLAKIQRSGVDDEEEEAAFGTPDYVAPESLIEGVIVDQRADIYSLGVLIYEVLTGEIPKGTYQLPSTLNPGIDRRFDDLVVKALAHDRDERFSNVSEIRAVLEAIARTPRLKMGGVTTNTAAVPAMAIAVAPPGAAGAPRARRTVHSLPPKSSGTGALVFFLLSAVAVSAGALYWFVLRDTSSPSPPAPPDFVNAGQMPGGSDPKTNQLGKGKEWIELPANLSAHTPPKTNGAGTGDAIAGDDPKQTGTATLPKGDTITPSDSPGDAMPMTNAGVAALPSALLSRAGRLRGAGTNNAKETVDLSRAESFSDFVQIRARNANWQALRATGDTVAKGADVDGATGVIWLEGRGMYSKIVRNDGTVWSNKNTQVFRNDITTAVQAVSGYQHAAVRHKDGTIKVWGENYGLPKAPVDPPVPVSDAVDISASQSVLAVVEASGRVICFGKDDAVEIREPENEGDRVIGVEATAVSFVAVTKSGRVFTWKNQFINDPEPAPDELGPAIAVRGGNGTYAAQRSDGTWFAWGANPNGIVDTINALPASPDLAFAGGGREDDDWGYVLWIEPAASSGAIASTDPVDIRVAEALDKFRGRYNDMAQAPFVDGLKAINEFYLPALERGAEEAEAEGDVATAKMIRDDMAKASKAVAAAGDGNPPLLVEADSNAGAIVSPRLNALRDTYRRAVQKLKDERAVTAKAVFNTCVSDLALLEAEIERDFGPVEASKVRLIREKALAGGAESLVAP